MARSGFLRPVISRILKPIVTFYLSHDRNYFYRNRKFLVKAGVFHPGFFYSTKFLLEYLDSIDVEGKDFLEVGCGTGLISIMTKIRGARVVASDIDELALQNTEINISNNGVDLSIVRSDLFERIPKRPFDIIAINPPFYPKDVKNEKEYAWHCGSDHNYFRSLFAKMDKYLSPDSVVLMVLSEDCNLSQIRSIAGPNKFRLNQVAIRHYWLDTLRIFQISADH